MKRFTLALWTLPYFAQTAEPLHTSNAKEVDKPVAGLLEDLKSRGLLQDTLVIWAGEFGRTPVRDFHATVLHLLGFNQSVMDGIGCYSGSKP